MSGNLRKIMPKVLFPSACILGESPMWHSERNSCFWVDIEQHRIYEYRWVAQTIRHYDLKQRVSLVIAGKKNELIVGIQGGIGKFDLELENLTMIANLPENWDTHRCNDGICDNKGRLLISSMALNHEKNSGSVYCVHGSRTVKKIIENATIPNGMAWSNDKKRLYYIDSPTGEVRSYLYEEQSGFIIFERTLINIPNHMGIPDGMTVDENGALWVALWGGFGVGKFDHDSGGMIGFIELPVPYVTSCAFVGEELDYMIITTARSGMTQKELLNFPESGHTFIVQPGLNGKADFTCAL